MQKIVDYYNSKPWIEKKIKEFVIGNKRIDECLALFRRNLISSRSVLEIGCSIGLTTYQLAEEYPEIDFTAIDIANEQIEFAKKFFHKENIKFSVVDITKDNNLQKYDLITLFDVYEHIPINERMNFANALKKILSENGQILLTCPSWLKSKNDIESFPERLQVVDEIVEIKDYVSLANIIGGHVKQLNLVSVWNRFDYSHCVISKQQPLQEIKVAKIPHNLIYKIRNKLGINHWQLSQKKRKKIVSRLLNKSK